jgi:anti-anti-sigma regulatory factor
MLLSTLESQAPIAIVRIAGRLNLRTTVDMRSVLQKSLTDHPAAVVIDLAGITLEDDIAATVLAAFARSAAAWPGCPVFIAAPDAALRGQLERMAIDRAALVFTDRHAAVDVASAVHAPQWFTLRLAPHPLAAAQARAMVAGACIDWALGRLADEAELIMTELVSNAVRHAGPGDLETAITRRDKFVHLSVRDGSRLRPRRRLADPGCDEGGRGLLLLDALAAGWGSTMLENGKVVWATLRIRGGRYCDRPGIG